MVRTVIEDMDKPDAPSVEPVKVEVLYFEGCPHHRPAVELVHQVVAELNVNMLVKEVEVNSKDDPDKLRFGGSPTILINDQDVEPAARQRCDFGFSCRTYPGAAGVPSRQMIRSAIEEAVTHTTSHPFAVGRSNWKQNLFTMPAVTAALLPAAACPACWPAYANIMAAMGVGFLINHKYLMPLTVMLLIVALAALGWRAPRRRGYGPFVLGVVAAAVLLIGKFAFSSTWAVYAGAALLIIASVWNGLASANK